MSLLYLNSQRLNITRQSSESSCLYLDCIESVYAGIETYVSVAQLIGRLRQSYHDIIGAVLIISSLSELIDLIRNQELLEDIPIILILPVDDPEMNSLGHSLSPRYMTSVGRNDRETRDVLIKFVEKLKSQYQEVIYSNVCWTHDQE